jgi:hypothetical protein
VRDSAEGIIGRVGVSADRFLKDTAYAFVEGDVNEIEPASVEPGRVEAPGVGVLRGNGVEFD